jgi:MFS family permease
MAQGASERSRLLGSPSVNSSQLHDAFISDRGRTFSRSSIANSEPFRDLSRASNSSGEGVDIDDIHFGLVRYGSLPSGTLSGLSPSMIDQNYGATTPKKCYPAVRERPASKILPTAKTTETDDSRSPRRVEEEDEPYSQFMNITPAKFWLVFGVIMACYFIACFDSTLMASSHPVITSYFDVSEAASWLSTVFLITSTAFQPLFGRLSDTFGRKIVFLASIAIFALTTLWCALATSIGSFIAARAFCGIGAGGTISQSLIVISDLVRIEERGVFQSHINIAFGLGSASGAAFGGFLCDTLGWRWAFGIQVPFLCVCFIGAVLFTPNRLGPMLLESSLEDPWLALRAFDATGSCLMLVSVTSLILSLNLGGNVYPWVSAPVITSIALCIIATACFLLVEKRAQQPVLPLRLLGKPPIANMVFANFLGGIASHTVLFNVPIFYQAVLLTSASSSGFFLALPSLVGSVAGVATGYIITYTRRLKPTLLFGAFVYVAGSVAVMALDRGIGKVAVMLLITGIPVGQGFVFPNTMMSALAVSSQADQAVVTTTIGLLRSLGTVFGVALSSVVFQNVLGVELEALVEGLRKDEIILLARSSIQSIRGLPEPYQSQGKLQIPRHSARISTNTNLKQSDRLICACFEGGFRVHHRGFGHNAYHHLADSPPCTEEREETHCSCWRVSKQGYVV